MKLLFLVSSGALVLACAVFAIMMSSMGSGRHMGAAVLAGIALPIIGVLAAVALASGLGWLWQFSPAAAIAAALAAATIAGVTVAPGLWKKARTAQREQASRDAFESVGTMDDAALTAALPKLAKRLPDVNERCNALARALEKRICAEKPDPKVLGLLVRALYECTSQPLPYGIEEPMCDVSDEAWQAIEAELWPPNPSWDRAEYVEALLRLDGTGALMERVLSRAPQSEQAQWAELARAAR